MGTQRIREFKVPLSDFWRTLELRWINVAGEVPSVAGSNGQFTVVFDGMYYPVRNIVERWVFHVELSGVGRVKTGEFCVKLAQSTDDSTRYHWDTGRRERLKEGKPHDWPLEDESMLVFAVLERRDINLKGDLADSIWP